MKILKFFPDFAKIVSLIAIVLTQIFPPANPRPIHVELPKSTGESDIIAAFVAQLQYEEGIRRPAAEPLEPSVQATPVRPEEWIRNNGGEWMLKPDK